MRQVTAGVPASLSMARPFIEVWDLCVCVMCTFGGVGGRGASVFTLLTTRRNMRPAPSMSTHMPLPCWLDLTVGGDDGENLGSRRGVDPEESERRKRQTEACLQPQADPRTASPDMVF